MRQQSKDVLAVEEAAGVLGIGRQTAYAQCRMFLATEGREGIPCHRIGRLILIYRHQLEVWLGFAITWPPEHDEPTAATATSPSKTPPSVTTHPPSARRNHRVSADQATLPF